MQAWGHYRYRLLWFILNGFSQNLSSSIAIGHYLPVFPQLPIWYIRIDGTAVWDVFARKIIYLFTVKNAPLNLKLIARWLWWDWLAYATSPLFKVRILFTCCNKNVNGETLIYKIRKIEMRFSSIISGLGYCRSGLFYLSAESTVRWGRYFLFGDEDYEAIITDTFLTHESVHIAFTFRWAMYWWLF